MIRQRRNTANLYVDDFRHWLLNRKGNEVVGTARTLNACPLATFFGCKGSVDIAVSPYQIQLDGTTHYTPEWARRFVRHVDQKAGHVTAYQALTILDEIEKGSL